MDLTKTKILLERIDIHYNTEFSKNDNLVKEWAKHLKNYEAKDVFEKLEEYLKDYTNSAPKLYNLIRNLKTIEEKHKLKNLYTICNFCKQKVNMEEQKKHHSRCLTIEYIEKNAKKYLNQQIIRNDYFKMSDEELNEKYEQMAKIIYKQTNNKFEKNIIKKYFETKEN